MESQRPRRSPAAGERKRDAERTRERILQAAVVEFGEHGYAGARISAIADRAGVNQQLISYYFDGKAGLYRALSERWRSISAGLNSADLPMHEVVGNFVQSSVDQRPWARLLAWEGLTGGGRSDAGADDAGADDAGAGDAGAGDAGAGDYFAAMVDDVRRRQRAGELAADLDPAYVLLVLFAAAMAPTVLPQVVERMTGEPATSPEFLATYREQLRRILEHLS
jgi:TetR/AcrR family transcriptional regulator